MYFLLSSIPSALLGLLTIEIVDGAAINLISDLINALVILCITLTLIVFLMLITLIGGICSFILFICKSAFSRLLKGRADTKE